MGPYRCMCESIITEAGYVLLFFTFLGYGQLELDITLENLQIAPIYGLHLIFEVLASGTIIYSTGGTEL